MKLTKVLALAGLAAVVHVPVGWAAGRIDAGDCRAFEKERAELIKAGVRENLAKGPEWAKRNLAKEQLGKIGRYIEISEQLDFRCPDVIASAAVRKMEEQARLRAAAREERERLWMERMQKIEPPVRKPETKLAKAQKTPADGTPPLPVRRSR